MSEWDGTAWEGTATKDIVTGFWHLGGTGGYMTPHDNDIIYNHGHFESSGRIAGVRVDQTSALNFIPFYAAVKIISEDVAGLPLNVYRKRPDGGREVAEDHWAQRLLHDQPNPEMTAFTWRETMMAHVLTWGNAYSEMELAGDGTVINLWPLRPDMMEPVRSRDAVRYTHEGRTYELAPGTLHYRYRIGGEQFVLPKGRVFHLHGLGYDGRMGYSVVDRMRRALALGIATETHGVNQFDKGMIPPAFLKTAGKLSPDAEKNVRASMENWRGLENRQRIAILEEGLDLATLGIPNDDAQFIATLEHAGGAMATGFRIPPSMLGMVNRSTSWGSGIEQQMIGYTSMALRGWVERAEQQYKMDILGRDDPHYTKHVMDAFLRGDTDARWKAYTSGWDRGIWSIDDIRAMEDKNPLPDGLGSRHFVPMNMIPLDQADDLTMQDRLGLLAQLTTAGIAPNDAAAAVDLPPITDEQQPPAADVPRQE
jgi:HK97 family phage portal protein